MAAQWANNISQDRHNRVRSSGNVVIRDAMAKRVKEARHVSVTACIDVSGGTSWGEGDKLSTDFGLLGVASCGRCLTVWA